LAPSLNETPWPSSIATERTRCGFAELVDQAEPAFAIAEGDQALAHQLDPHRRTVRLGDFFRQQERRPTAVQQFAHQRAPRRRSSTDRLFTRHHGDVFSKFVMLPPAIIGSRAA
jgi:hypothetical protein